MASLPSRPVLAWLATSLLAVSPFATSPLSAQAPVMIHDIETGPATNPNSSPRHFAVLGSKLYFAATTEEQGTELVRERRSKAMARSSPR